MLIFEDIVRRKPIAELISENLSGTEWAREALYTYEGRFYLLKDASESGAQMLPNTVTEAVLWAVDSFDDAELEGILENIIEAAK